MAAPTSADVRDTFFALWTITAEGHRDPQRLHETIEMASTLMRKAGAECHLFVTIGGPCDLIAWGRGIDDEQVMEFIQAMKGFGTITTTFIKAKEFSLDQYKHHLDRIAAHQRIIP